LSTSLLPFHAATTFLQKVVNALEKEKENATNIAVRVALKDRVPALLKALKKTAPSLNKAVLDTIINDVFADIQEKKSPRNESQALTLVQIESIINRIKRLLPAEAKRANKYVAELTTLEEEIRELVDNIGRAPADAVLQPLLTRLSAESAAMGQEVEQYKALLETLKQQSNRLIEIARQLDNLYKELSTEAGTDRALIIAENTKALLHAFALRATETKLKELENRFIESFRLLARKDEIVLSIRIDPKTYNISLFNEEGQPIDKSDLSAGERQIYAISILDGLARTSGRRLPVIIDTPLGRLDSKHRRKLVDHYFPHASHQVIILSTDTEIDRAFYEDLSIHVSHAYHLEFDQATRSTQESEGYFWKLDKVI
jgi:DNA sulfur modification protein DndD